MRMAYPGIILAAILFTGAIGMSYASEPDVKILAKEKQGLILLLVKNQQSISIHGIELEILDGEITSVKTSRGWAVETSSSDSTSLILRTGVAPIEAGERAVFFLDASKINTIISWSVLDRFGSTLDIDNTRTVVRDTIAHPAESAAESLHSSNMRLLTVTTDKIFYNKDDKMIISGVFDPNTDLTITIYTPSGLKMKITEKTDSMGSFNVLHILQGAESGGYNLKVRQADTTAETTFRVL